MTWKGQLILLTAGHAVDHHLMQRLHHEPLAVAMVTCHQLQATIGVRLENDSVTDGKQLYFIYINI